MLKKNYNKIFLVGNKSFLQESLFLKLKNNNLVKINYNKIFKEKISENDLVVNFSNDINFYYKRYFIKYDRNYILAKFLKRTNTKLIILSTRQVYKPNMNLTENSQIEPISNYGKNCLVSEKNCMKTLKSRLLILRLTNIIGFENRKKKRPSLVSSIINGYKKGVIKFDNNYYLLKDLLPIQHFTEIFFKITRFDLKGIYNVGTGKSIKVSLFINKIFNNKKINIKIDNKKKINDSHFSVNPNKLFDIIGYNISNKMIIKEFNLLKKKINKI